MNADYALGLYYALRERFARPPSQSIAVGMGWQWSSKCTRCIGTHHEPRLLPGRVGKPRIGAGDYVERCTRCGSPWEREEVEEIRSRRGSVRPDSADRRMVLLTTLERAIFPPPRPTRLLPTLPRVETRLWRRVYLGMLVSHVCDGTPVTGLGERFEGELVSRGMGTSDRSVQRILRLTREVIEARLGG